MAGDRNTFSLGPSRIDVDRDFRTSLDQTISRTETIIQETTSVTELNIARSNGTALRGEITSLLTTEGAAFNAFNATNQTIQQNDTVIFGKLTTGDYAIVGILTGYGAETGAGSLVSVTVSGAQIGPCWPAIDKDNVLGLGVNTMFYARSGPFTSGVVSAETLYSTVNGTAGTFTTAGSGYWYGFHGNKLYMCLRPAAPDGNGNYESTLRYYDSTTNTWPLIQGIGGRPYIVGDVMFFSQSNNGNVFRVAPGGTTATLIGSYGASNDNAFVGNQYREWRLGNVSNIGSTFRLNTRPTSPTTVAGSVTVLGPGLPPNFGYNIGERDPLTRESHSMSCVDSAGWLMSVTDGTTSYAAVVATGVGSLSYIDDFMLGTGPGAMFGNDPAYLTITGTWGAGSYSMYMTGGYSPDAGASFIPAIWSLVYNPANGSYQVNLVWQATAGTGVAAFAFGLHNYNAPTDQFIWFAGTTDVVGPNSLYVARLTP